MKKDLKEEEGVGEYYLQARIDYLQSVIDKQNEGLALYKELVESNDRRIGIQRQIIDTKDEVIAIVERQKLRVEQENLRLNIAIAIVFLVSIIYCIYKIFTI